METWDGLVSHLRVAEEGYFGSEGSQHSLKGAEATPFRPGIECQEDKEPSLLAGKTSGD